MLAVAAGLVAWAFFFGGASGTGATAPLGTVAVVVAAAVVVAWALGVLGLPRLDGAASAAVVGAIGLVSFAGLSIVWSIAGDRSWDALAKGLVVLAFGVVGLALAVLPDRPLRHLALLLAALLWLVLAWALLGKAIPALGPDDADRVARLKGSIGYWNALALLADAALGPAVWLLVSVQHRLARLGGALLVYTATVVVLLTQSRAGLLAGLIVLGFVIALSGRSVEACLCVLLAGVPGVLVSAWAFTRPALVEDGAARADRVADGRPLAILLLVGAGVALMLATRVPVERLVETRRRLVVRSLLGAGLGIVLVGAVGLVLAVGNPVRWAGDQLGGSGAVVNDPGRLGSLETNNRTVWWGEAWHVFRAHPLAGTGARTFEIARKRYRTDAENVTEPHSVPMQLLADGGIVAFGLGLLLVIGLVLGIRATLRRLKGNERAAAVALGAFPLAFGLHALVDYDLDFLAVVAPTALVAAALLGAGQPLAVVRSHVVLAVAAIAAAAACVWVLVAPALSSRAVDSAYARLDSDDLAGAAASARRAQRLNPLSTSPLVVRAAVASRAGDNGAAERFLEQATRLQPENPDTWYQLGIFRQLTGDQCGAYQALNQAYTLDQRSSLFYPGGPLDQARAAVNDRQHPACGR